VLAQHGSFARQFRAVRVDEGGIPGRSDAVSVRAERSKGPSVTDAVAAAFFSLDPETGHILFPAAVQQVVIDVGARQSDYLARKMELNDGSTGLILFDPMPHSYIPVANMASEYQMRNRTEFPLWLDVNYMNSVFPVRAAVSDEEGTAEFNVGDMPACGSLLEFRDGNTPHWCMNSRQKIKAVTLRLESILRMIPPRIEDVHVKVDAEGFDLNVLRGAGRALTRARTVIIECINYKTRQEIPTGTFNCSDALEYMETLGAFQEVTPSSKGHGENLFWMQLNWTSSSGELPEFFKARLIFTEFYRHVEQLLQGRRSVAL
jgi:FkbM family methyltransferase